MMELPPDAADLAARWRFDPEEELPGGYCSRVYANSSLVLKVPFQGEEMVSGWRMAVALSGCGCPLVYEHDPASGALLMERIVPGTKLSEAGLSDEEGIQLALSFRERVVTLPTDGLLPISAYFSAPTPFVQRLMDTQEGTVALHGDLHHENLLLGPDGWRLIDPKGLYGEPAYEAAAYIRNPWPGISAMPLVEEVLIRRVLRFSEAWSCDPWRVWAWATVEVADANPDDPWYGVWQAMLRVEREFQAPSWYEGIAPTPSEN